MQEINKELDKNKLDDQINEMIKAKYTFIHYNGLRRAKLSQITNNFETNIFDNSVVVIDEAHNLISRIVNRLNRPNSLAMRLYNFLKSFIMKKLFKFNWINGLGLSFIFTGFLYFLKLENLGL